MNSIIMWDKPEKVMSVEKWKSISACGAPPGVYTPNMSKEDMFKWKGKVVGKRKGSPRVEIRKTFQKCNGLEYPNNKNVFCQALLVISLEDIDGLKGCKALLSLNGKAGLSITELNELNLVIEESKNVLRASRAPVSPGCQRSFQP